MYLISYICKMKKASENIRTVFWTKEFSEFFNKLPDKVQDKFIML